MERTYNTWRLFPNPEKVGEHKVDSDVNWSWRVDASGSVRGNFLLKPTTQELRRAKRISSASRWD